MDRDGEVEETCEDGSRYEGQYRAGKRHGRGTFTWADGSRYEGDFLDGNFFGCGSYFWIDGREYTGQWAHNRMSGQGAYTWTDGRKYVGEYSNDRKHGHGVFTATDGRQYDGEWKDGLQHGLGVLQSSNGERRGEWKDGVLVRWTSQVHREGNNTDLNDDARKGKEENNGASGEGGRSTPSFSCYACFCRLARREVLASEVRWDDACWQPHLEEARRVHCAIV